MITDSELISIVRSDDAVCYVLSIDSICVIPKPARMVLIGAVGTERERNTLITCARTWYDSHRWCKPQSKILITEIDGSSTVNEFRPNFLTMTMIFVLLFDAIATTCCHAKCDYHEIQFTNCVFDDLEWNGNMKSHPIKSQHLTRIIHSLLRASHECIII